MNNGAGGVMKLHPYGGTVLTVSLGAVTPTSPSTYLLSADVGRLRLAEEDRVQWEYDQGGGGGRAIRRKVELVRVVFPIIIKATTATARIEAYRALLAAVTARRGGMLEYAPENPAGSASTFYHYQASGAPALTQTPGNRWDSSPESDGFFTLEVEVELVTQPIATGDPETPVNLIAPSQANQTAVPGEGTYALIGQADKLAVGTLKGTEPAVTRFIVYGADGQDVGRVIAFRKSGEGKDADHILDAASASVVGSELHWSTVSDANRYGGSYRRLNPPEDANGTTFTLRFTLTDPASWDGVFAVFAIGYDEAGVSGAWAHYVSLRMGGVEVQRSEPYGARDSQNWQLVYGGELELPPASLSLAEQAAGYGSTVFIDWCSTRASGIGGFRVDALVLVQVRDRQGEGAVVDVMADGDDAVKPHERLVIENLVAEGGQPLELAHVLTSGDLEFKRTLSIAPRGEFLTLDPTEAHTVRLVHERPVAPAYVENLPLYKAVHWRQLAHFYGGQAWYGPWDSQEGWALASGAQYSTFLIHDAARFEGWYAGKLVATRNASYAGYGRAELPVNVDFTQDLRFEDDDFLCYARYWDHVPSAVTRARVGFVDSAGVMAYTTVQTATAGYVNRYVRRSDLSSANVIDWARIRKVFFDYGVKAGAGNLNSALMIDHVRVEKAHPDRPSEPNVTGGKWSFDHGKFWTLTEDMSRWPFTTYRDFAGSHTRRDPGITLACIPEDTATRHTAVLNVDAPLRFRFRARLTSHLRSESPIGLFWCGDDAFLGVSPSGYALYLSYQLNGIGGHMVGAALVKQTAGSEGYPAGVPAGDSFRFVTFNSFLEPIHVGVEVDRSTGLTGVYLVPEGETTVDVDLWDAAHRLWSFTDLAFMDKLRCGLLDLGGGLRADKIELRDNTNRLYASDDLRVLMVGQYRTIVPFTP